MSISKLVETKVSLTPPCPECNDTGSVMLLTSTVPCLSCPVHPLLREGDKIVGHVHVPEDQPSMKAPPSVLGQNVYAGESTHVQLRQAATDGAPKCSHLKSYQEVYEFLLRGCCERELDIKLSGCSTTVSCSGCQRSLSQGSGSVTEAVRKYHKAHVLQ